MYVFIMEMQLTFRIRSFLSEWYLGRYDNYIMPQYQQLTYKSELQKYYRGGQTVPSNTQLKSTGRRHSRDFRLHPQISREKT